MASVSLTGADVLKLDDRLLSNFADGTVANIEFPNNVVEAKKGKDGSALYAFNTTGFTANVTLRIVLGSPDDKYVNSRFQEYRLDPAAFLLIGGVFTKRSGDGAGNIVNTIYRMGGGVIQSLPNTQSNVEGETEQAVAIWNIVFTNSNRIQA